VKWRPNRPAAGLTRNKRALFVACRSPPGPERQKGQETPATGRRAPETVPSGRKQIATSGRGPRRPEASDLLAQGPRAASSRDRPWRTRCSKDQGHVNVAAQPVQGPATGNPHRWPQPQGISTRNPSKKGQQQLGSQPAFWQRDRAAPRPRSARASSRAAPPFFRQQPYHQQGQQQAEQRARTAALAQTLTDTWRGGSCALTPTGSMRPVPEVLATQPATADGEAPRPIKPTRAGPPEAPRAASQRDATGWDSTGMRRHWASAQRSRATPNPRRVRADVASRQIKLGGQGHSSLTV